VASVAQMWVAPTYDDLRRAGPDRGTRVRGVLDRYVNPWFGPQTSSVGDITYFMVHEWLLTLVGRGRSEPDDRPPTPGIVGANASEIRKRHPTNRQFEVPPEAAKRLRAEHHRVCALHERSLKLAVTAQLLNRAVSTVGLMAK
jgi:hypothetical protein